LGRHLDLRLRRRGTVAGLGQGGDGTLQARGGQGQDRDDGERTEDSAAEYGTVHRCLLKLL
jgi:hypothetical protein